MPLTPDQKRALLDRLRDKWIIEGKDFDPGFNVNLDGTLSTLPLLGEKYDSFNEEMPVWRLPDDAAVPLGSQVCFLFDEQGKVVDHVLDAWLEGKTWQDLPASIRLRFCTPPLSHPDPDFPQTDYIDDTGGLPGTPGINPIPVVDRLPPPPPPPPMLPPGPTVPGSTTGSCCVPGLTPPPSTQQACGGKCSHDCKCHQNERSDDGWRLILEIS